MYNQEDGRTTKDAKDGEELLANFEATITKETKYVDAHNTSTILTIEGNNSQENFSPVEVNAEKFASLSWVMPAWGVTAIIQPGSGTRDDLRTSIQFHSKPKRETIYTHTGWINIKKKAAFLHAGGAITPAGNNPSVRVELPHELKKFSLINSCDPKSAIAATIALHKVTRPEIMWPLIAATLCPMIGACDFAVHITGRTGTFKSELAALMQSHYGQLLDSRSLPGSWSSTANALEAQAYKAKNALFCIDDFIPSGTTWQVKAYQKTADQIIRGQGNQAGRARLTDVSQLQETMYPRGLVLSTGEDTPEGQSVRGRMMILELSPGDIEAANLSRAQADRLKFSQTSTTFIQYLAGNLPTIREDIRREAIKLRNQSLQVGHARTPGMVGRMIATLDTFLAFARAQGVIGEKKLRQLKRESHVAILKAAAGQDQFLTAADPCESFCEGVRHILAAHIGHLRTIEGGIPKQAETLGWTSDTPSNSDLPSFKAHGKTIGWIDWDVNEIYIDVTAAYADIRRHSGGGINIGKQTMLKRLKEAGHLSRVDEARSRNTIRVKCQGHSRQVLCFNLQKVLDRQEVPA